MTESYEDPSGDGGWDTDEQVFDGAPVVGAGSAPEDGVEQALTALDGLDELPPAEHVARYEQVHDALRAHLNGDA